MRRLRLRLTAAGSIGVAGVVGGTLLLFLAHGTAAAVGLVVGLVSVAFLMAGVLPPGMLGGWLLGALPPGARSRSRDRVTPAPDYIEAAAEPSERDWADERARYADKHRDQQQTRGHGRKAP